MTGHPPCRSRILAKGPHNVDFGPAEHSRVGPNGIDFHPKHSG